MAKKKEKQEYGNESIVTLKGADRVRKRPAVIFGSDGIEGCQHSAFEILSNSIDEAREGYGKEIIRLIGEEAGSKVKVLVGLVESFNEAIEREQRRQDKIVERLDAIKKQ